MNEDKYLKNTKKRLTIIFTSLVFIIAFSLEVVFFTGKYFRENAMEKSRFEEVTSRLSDLKNIDELKKITKFGRENRPRKGMRGGDFFSILIFDKSQNLIFQDINESMDDDMFSSIFDHKDNKELGNNYYTFVKSININQNDGDYKVIFFKNSRYNLTDLLEDILGFLLITSVFSFIFYFVGLKFVDKTLKPLEDNLESMKNFVNDAGHELKTPISIIHGNLQIIKETKEFDSEAIKESIEEIKRLDKLIESLVNLSTINSLKESVNLKLKEEIQYIIEKYDQIAKENDITINLKSKLDYKLNTNKEYFYIVFSNIISNAIKYNEKGGKIDIKIEKNKISIEDSGKGINDRDKPKIWDKFYRGGNLRNTTGFGIGLSLVKKICDLYAWEIKVESNEGKGTKFEVIFR